MDEKLTNSTFIGALLVIIAVDVMVFLGQIAVHDINPDSPLTFMSGTDDFIQQYNQGSNGNYTLNTTYSGSLPGTASSSSDTGNIFVDTYVTVRDWITSGTRMFNGIFGGPYFIVAALGVPAAFSFAVGFLWYVFTLFVVVAFLTGRS